MMEAERLLLASVEEEMVMAAEAMLRGSPSQRRVHHVSLTKARC